MSLFEHGDFHLHSGGRSTFKIDCNWLMDEDWCAVASLLRSLLPKYGGVVGIPTGGLQLAKEMHRGVTISELAEGKTLPTLLVDDVLTTGASMEEWRAKIKGDVIGAVVFARGSCPDWVLALFQMKENKP